MLHLQSSKINTESGFNGWNIVQRTKSFFGNFNTGLNYVFQPTLFDLSQLEDGVTLNGQLVPQQGILERDIQTK